jgi:hypothetical protein
MNVRDLTSGFYRFQTQLALAVAAVYDGRVVVIPPRFVMASKAETSLAF